MTRFMKFSDFKRVPCACKKNDKTIEIHGFDTMEEMIAFCNMMCDLINAEIVREIEREINEDNRNRLAARRVE